MEESSVTRKAARPCSHTPTSARPGNNYCDTYNTYYNTQYTSLAAVQLAAIYLEEEVGPDIPMFHCHSDRYIVLIFKKCICSLRVQSMVSAFDACCSSTATLKKAKFEILL